LLIKGIPRLLSRALKHCDDVPQTIKSTVNYLDGVCDEALVNENMNKCCFLPSFEPVSTTTSTNSKKRKNSEESSDH
jgi:hypothetical protein